MLTWLASAPPAAILGLIFVSCLIENCFPPSPSDVFVALAAFIAHRGHLSPWTIFFVALAGGMLGSWLVYGIARRHADRFETSRIGRALLPPRATAFFKKEYHRYGLPGIFLVRLLPGFRSVVAPFAGLSRLSVLQVLVPVLAACVLWYGALTYVGFALGRQWEEVLAILSRLNRGLAITAVIVAAAVVAGVLLWRRSRRQPS